MSNFTFASPGVPPEGLRSTYAVILGALSILLVLYAYPRSSRPKSASAIYELGGFSILNARSFFNKRFDFLWENFKQTGEELFQFRVLQHRVVAVSGEAGRKVFFGDKDLDLPEGYRIFMGGSPDISEIIIKPGSERESTSEFSKRLLILLRKERLTDVLPSLFDDINTRMLSWGSHGRINPFQEVYNLVFQMTVRMASCQELSNDTEAVERLAKLYWDLEKSSTPVTLLMPWFPSPAKKTKDRVTIDLYMMFKKYVDLRREAEVPSSESIDLMISEGLDTPQIIEFLLAVIFAGVLNTGINSCWTLIYLCSNLEWKQKVAAEVNSLILKYTNTDSSDPLHKRLSAIPINAWEDEMPAMDLVIRETLRLSISGTALRRNIAGDLKVGDKIVPKGYFLAYSLADVNFSPEIYEDPFEFDPTRYMQGREEDKKSTFAYLGWGAGRHPCLGMKIAKLEIKIIIALFFAGYELELVDKSGKFPVSLPQPDRNDIQQARPLGEPCYLKFTRVVE